MSWLGVVAGRDCCGEGLSRVGLSWGGGCLTWDGNFIGRVCLREGLSRVGVCLKWGCSGEGLSVCPKLRNPFLHTLSWPLLIRNVCCLVRAETRLTEGRK